MMFRILWACVTLVVFTVSGPGPAHAGRQTTVTRPLLPAQNLEDLSTAYRGRRSLSKASTSAAASSTIRDCLGAIKYLKVVYPGEGSFTTASSVFNLRTVASPAVVVYPLYTSHVAAVVKCCAQHGKKPVPRSGGHSYTGYSVQSGKVVVDMGRMNKVTLAPGGATATIQAGAKLGPVYYAIWTQSKGKLGFPAGTCPTVGIGGHIQAGGFGMMARKYGLASDRLVAATMVDASGRIITADSTQHTDLLWAAKGGGGGNFGIFTSFTVRPVSVPATVTVVTVQWPASAYAAAIQWYQGKMPTLDVLFSSDLFLGYGSAQLHGLYLGPVERAKAVLAGSNIASVGASQQADYQAMSWGEATAHFASQAQAMAPTTVSSLQLGSGVQLASRDFFKAKSNFIKKPISSAGVDIAARALSAASTRNIGGWMQFHAYGGALNQIKAADTAFVHRDKLASIQFYVSWTNPSAASTSTSWLQDTWASLQPYVDSAAYQNYLDADLGAAGLKAYYGSNLARLQAVKAGYDPATFFSYPSSIPPIKQS